MITLLQLEYFRKLAMNEHLTQTAQELRISQTALSSMIINLEKELGVQLFDRSNRSVRLNEVGKTYLKYVDDALTSLEIGHATIRKPDAPAKSSVTITTSTSAVWAPLLRSFCMAYPQHKVVQKRLKTEQLREALTEMPADIIVANEDLEHGLQIKGAEKTWFKNDGFYLCISPQHPLAGRKSVYMEELRNETFINPVDTNLLQISLEKLFFLAGFEPHIAMECNDRASLVAANVGVVLTSELAARVDLLKPNLYVPIADEYAVRKLFLFHRPRSSLSVAANDFCDFCVNYYSKPE